MNGVLNYLSTHRRRLGLERFGLGERLSCVVITPRFHASSHVLFLVLAEAAREPALVVKMPRLPAAREAVTREFTNLAAAQAVRKEGLDSAPRVVAFEECFGRPMLVETALVGTPLGPPAIRRRPKECCEAILSWLFEVQKPGASAAAAEPDWFERLIEQPLRRFAELFPQDAEEWRLVSEMDELVAPLRTANIPLVLEHGDLSSPNVMQLKHGGVGVVDWELAQPRGLPACDLFFFLAYVAFSRQRAKTTADHVRAFDKSMMGRSAWARPFVLDYARKLGLAESVLTPLLALCWMRYLASLLERLGQNGGSERAIGSDTAAWIRSNRYFALWRHTLAHRDRLNWSEGAVAEFARIR